MHENEASKAGWAPSVKMLAKEGVADDRDELPGKRSGGRRGVPAGHGLQHCHPVTHKSMEE